MAYADYTFYTDVYLGNVIPSADFNRLAQRSSDIIDIFTGNKIDNTVISDEETYTKIKKANCALAEQIYYKETFGNAMNGAMKGWKIKFINDMASGYFFFCVLEPFQAGE